MKIIISAALIVGSVLGCGKTLPTSTPLSVTTTSLPSAELSSPYAVFLTAQGGTPPYTWSLFSGQLPVGIQLSATGGLSGVAEQEGDYQFVVSVTDAAQVVQYFEIKSNIATEKKKK